ncbi:hypothetical protein PsYK624_149700 [Phanerochaete sordida]|uniref:Uncharacterized protein n=1 Tax=Phanerochaete sordida TaxID=48140 RepID=A0A9P3GNI7_9APHY|nr:hypothetical protein PsYK624_149700 [Phanerochaete sordida]
MCTFDLADIPGEELPVSGPLPDLWDILRPQVLPEQPLEASAAPLEHPHVLQHEELNEEHDALLSLYNAACNEAPEGHELSYIFENVDWALVDAEICPPPGEDEASLLFPGLDDLVAHAPNAAPVTLDAVSAETLAFTDSVIANLKGLYGVETAGVPTIAVVDEDADAKFLALFPAPEELLDPFPESAFSETVAASPSACVDEDADAQLLALFPAPDELLGAVFESASSETVTAASSPWVDVVAVIEDTGDHDAIDAAAATAPTTEMDVQHSQSAGADTKSADPERPIVKVDFLAAIIDLTADEEFDDDEADAAHAALDASERRGDAQISFLNRIIDDLEADKARLADALAAREATHLLDADHISSLSADHTELRGAFANLKTAYTSAQIKGDADTARIAELRARLAAVEDQFQRLHTEHQDARGTITTLSISVEDHKGALGDADTRIQGLHSQLYEEREIAQGTREHLATMQNTVLELRGQLHEEAASSREAVARQTVLEAEVEEARASVTAANVKSEEQAADAAKAFDALYRDKEALQHEYNTSQEALAAFEAQLQDERETSAAKIAAIEQECQDRLDQQQLQHDEERAAADERSKAAEAEFKAEIARLQDQLAQTNTAFGHVAVQAAVLAEQQEIHSGTRAALDKERRVSARKSADIKHLRQENANLREQLTAAEHTSFKLDEELGSVMSRVNSISEEKRTIAVQLAEVVEVNQKMGIQMEDVREELAALYDEHEASRNASEVSIDEVRQLKSDFEEQTCETLESVLGEKEALRAAKGAAEKELARVRRTSQGEIDALKKDIDELRAALQRQPQRAELYETKKLVNVYTERFANCTQCAVTSTPQARLARKGKENISTGEDSLFSISVDNILSTLIFVPTRSPLSSPTI